MVSDSHKEYMRRYREEHKEEIAAKRKEYNKKRRDIVKECNRRWRENNPEKWREICRINSKKYYAKKSKESEE